jgi:hypothetical protein
MDEHRLTVPTYNASIFVEQVDADVLPEFGPPHVPVVIREANGIRIVLGSHDYDDQDAPDIQIERRPRGWAIFLHPVGGSDASGYVYFVDDGRSFLLPENGLGPTPSIEVVEREDSVPDMDPP